MRTNSTMLAVAALLLCSACANQTTTKASTLFTDSAVQVSSIHWDEELRPTQSARVSNGNLIMMR